MYWEVKTVKCSGYRHFLKTFVNVLKTNKFKKYKKKVLPF